MVAIRSKRTLVNANDFRTAIDRIKEKRLIRLVEMLLRICSTDANAHLMNLQGDFMAALIECVPNFSEGRDIDIVNRIVDVHGALRAVLYFRLSLTPITTELSSHWQGRSKRSVKGHSYHQIVNGTH